MQLVPIQPIPNQEFSVPLDNNQWDIALKSANGIIAVTLTLNGTEIISGMRAVAGSPIITCQYQESGNFNLITQNGEIPDYTQFGTTQYLVYSSADELASLRAEPSFPLTAENYFNSLGGLPLRFSPQGYTLAS